MARGLLGVDKGLARGAKGAAVGRQGVAKIRQCKKRSGMEGMATREAAGKGFRRKAKEEGES